VFTQDGRFFAASAVGIVEVKGAPDTLAGCRRDLRDP
jgi:hypothetical protein